MRYFYITAISLITIIAIGLRIYPYTIGRSLWLDEAALANNLLLEHTILNNMTYGQAAPPLFKLVSIMNIKILGMTEAALRLFPLVCGIISIGLFYLISRKILNSKLVQTSAFNNKESYARWR